MSLLFQHKTKSAPQVDNPYWMSFSDMMSGMLIIFILVCIALLYKLSKIEYDVNQNIIVYNKSIEERTKILEDIKNDLLNQAGIKVEITDNDSVIRIPEGSLHFDNAKFEIKDDLKPNAEKIGEILYKSILKDDRWQYLETVFIEGHTDSKPMKDPNFLMGNWELSAKRAISLWKFWTENKNYGNSLKEFKNKEGKYLFSVSGYADTRRVAEEIDEEHMQKNRRIDIRFTTKQPTIKYLKEVIAPLKEK